MPRTRLTLAVDLGVVATALVALSFQAWVLVTGHHRALDLMSLRAANRAQATAQHAHGLFRQVDLILQDLQSDFLAARPGKDLRGAPGAAGTRAFLQMHASRLPQVIVLHVLDAQGRFLHSTMDPLPDVPVADREYFLTQRRSRRDHLFVSGPLVGRATRRWNLFLSRRLSGADGRFLGVVVAGLDLQAVGDTLTAVDRPQWVLRLYDRDRHLVASRPEPGPGDLEALGQASADLRLDEARQSGPLRFEGTALGLADPHLWAANRLEDPAFVAVAGFSRRVALETWRRDLRLNLAVAAMILAGCASVLVLHRRSHHAQRVLRHREAYFRALFDASPEAIAVVHRLQVVDANARYRALFPETGEVPPWALAPAVQWDGSPSEARGRDLAVRALAEGLQRTPWTCLHPDGTPFEAELTLMPFRNRGRDLLIAVVRDLTERRAMEERLHQAQKMDALGQLAGGVAHDFNNMLAAILGSAELLASRTPDEGQRRLATTILAAAERAGQLTRKLLAFARKGRVLSTPTDVHRLVAETLALLERTIDPRIALETDLGAGRATVVGDPAQIQNALLNLGVNARDAMPEGGRLCFRTTVEVLSGGDLRRGTARLEPGEYLRLEVSDTGQGIPEADLPRIFDPFFTTKGTDKGTGLGLAAVHGTLASHRGAVEVESRPGTGTTFHLWLPLADPGVREGQADPTLPPKGSGRILVVDDEPLVRAAVAHQVQALGYEAVPFGDPLEALVRLEAEPCAFAAALVDMVMPGLTGRELARRMRQADPTLPVVLMSGFPGADAPVPASEAPAAFLQKPFGTRDLAAVLAHTARREA